SGRKPLADRRQRNLGRDVSFGWKSDPTATWQRDRLQQRLHHHGARRSEGFNQYRGRERGDRSERDPVSERRRPRGNFQFRDQHRDADGAVARREISLFSAAAREDQRRSGALREKEEGNELNGLRRSPPENAHDVTAARKHLGILSPAVSIHPGR